MDQGQTFTYTNKKGVLYFLNSKLVTLKNGKQQIIFFFTRDKRETAAEMPVGYEVFELERTALPLLRKSK